MKEFLAKIQKKIQAFDEAHANKLAVPEKTCRVKIPFFKIVFAPYNLLLDNGKSFFSLALPYALLITLVAFACGFSYVCLYANAIKVDAFCSTSTPLYLLYTILKLFFVAAFAINWCQTALKKEPFSWRLFISVDWRVLKLAGVFLLIVALNFMPLVSGYILYIRVPNPDWRIETLFFAVVALGFVVPFVVLRFYSLVAFIIYGQKIPSLKQMWCKTMGNGFSILTSLFVIFILTMFILGSFYRNFQGVVAEGSFYIGFMSEFLYDILYLLFAALLVNHCCLQQQILYADEQGEASNDQK